MGVPEMEMAQAGACAIRYPIYPEYQIGGGKVAKILDFSSGMESVG
jgi:hypothetical protein